MPPNRPSAIPDPWPALAYADWKDTLATLHMWLQMVGKVRVACAPWVNHQWHVTLHLTSQGLTSRPMPLPAGGSPGSGAAAHTANERARARFQIDVDFLSHELRISTSDGRTGGFALEPRTVAAFHRAFTEELDRMAIPVRIHPSPNEVPDPIPFAENERDRSYDPDSAERFFQVLSSTARVFEDFRAEFIGKSSPVHFFWGAMDLAVTRFSGRRAPEHPGGVPALPDWITREAYSHEVSSAGFWPGGEGHPEPIFYAYVYPEPKGYSEAAVEPEAARWHGELQEFVLPYEAVRAGAHPERELVRFLRSTYEAAAELGAWDREGLEWPEGARPPTGGWGP